MEKVIYLLIFIAYFAIVRALFIRMEYRDKERKKRAERRERTRNFESINYDNFNPNTGRYEN